MIWTLMMIMMGECVRASEREREVMESYSENESMKSSSHVRTHMNRRRRRSGRSRR
jgi:hypothetical protein